jgi:hypothetical protein
VVTDTEQTVARLIEKHRTCCCDEMHLALIALCAAAKINRDEVERLTAAVVVAP